MRKNFGPQTYFFPLPVLIIATYDKDEKPNAMNVAWGGIYDYNKVELNLSADHKTSFNLYEKMAFTVAFADTDHVKEADYVGIVSGNNVENKIEKAGLTTTKSQFVDAPVINEFPVTLECKVSQFLLSDDGLRIVGDIVNVSAKEEVLNSNGEIDIEKLHIISFDPVKNTYIEMGKKVGDAFCEGLKIKDR